MARAGLVRARQGVGGGRGEEVIGERIGDGHGTARRGLDGA